MPEPISSRTSPQMPSRLGAAKACSWMALSRSTTVAATIASPATSTRSSMPSTPGTNRPPRSTRPSAGSRTSELSQGPSGPSGRGSGSSRTRARSTSSASASTLSTTCSASPAASSAAPFFLRRPNTSLSFPVGYDRSVSIPTRCAAHGGLCACIAPVAHGGVTAGGPEAPLGPRRVGKLRDLLEADPLDLLDDELGNPVEALEPHRLVRVEIHHDHLDLPTVPGINRPRGIHESDTAAGGETGSRVHEGRVPLRQRHRHSGGQHGPLSGLQFTALGGPQIGPRVTRVRVHRKRYVGVDAPDQHVQGVTAHGLTSKARARRAWSGSSMAARISSGRPLSMKWSTLTSRNRASARTATGPSGPPIRPVALE